MAFWFIKLNVEISVATFFVNAAFGLNYICFFTHDLI